MVVPSLPPFQESNLMGRYLEQIRHPECENGQALAQDGAH